MAGILNSKERVVDAVITQEGKRQIAKGNLNFVFGTVSDRHSYYEKDVVSGSTDATLRVYFEPYIESINDSIVMESDDSGMLLGYPTTPDTYIASDGTVLKHETVSGKLKYEPVALDSQFASLADSIISSATDRFKNLQSIGTRDPDEPLDLKMEITPKSHDFTINNKFPWPTGPTSALTNIDYVEPLFFDEMLAKSINFQYLPPLKSDDVSGDLPDNNFGQYTKFHRPQPMSLEDIMRHLNIIPENQMNTPISDPDSDYDF